jgi:hypothetical chaperone protein
MQNQNAHDSALAVGIDFGTTNSSMALADGDNGIQIVTFPFAGVPTPSYRSVIYLEQMKSAAGTRRMHSLTGPAAIEHYLEAEEKGRLIQSLKSHLPSRLLTSTNIFGRNYAVEDLISRILKDLRLAAEEQWGRRIHSAVVGRPVRFVGSGSDEDDDFAVARLRVAFRHAGFEQVEFELEPVAAAWAYESTLDRDELILIGDFGGGTSDFSLLRVGPGVRGRGRSKEDLLGSSGVGLAGDAFDARIVHHLVSPALGSNSEIRSMGKLLPAVPSWVFSRLEHWHHLSFLRTNNVREILKRAVVLALEPEKIEALRTLIEEDLGYQLHQAVQQVKFELSHSQSAEFRFCYANMDLRIALTRSDFEAWIQEDLRQLEQCIDSLLEKAGVPPSEVDRVFLTGGTSFVPAVNRLFTSRFGEDRISRGHEFTSVAHGLALRAAETGT